MPKAPKRGGTKAKRDAVDESDGFARVLMLFKGQDAVEDVSCLLSPGESLDSDALRRLVVAWPKCRKYSVGNSSPVPRGEWNAWKWLWESVSYDAEELSRIAGVGDNVTDLMNVLIGNRLIFPDGSVADTATRIIRQVLRSRLEMMGIPIGGSTDVKEEPAKPKEEPAKPKREPAKRG